MSRQPTIPTLRKAAKVQGKTLVFRDAGIKDAEFILKLRTDIQKSQYLSPVSPDLQKQQAWLKQYALSGNQAYFIIEYQGAPVGTVRLYDPQSTSFCWGSWILVNERPRQAAMESALMVYAYAVDHLGFQAAHFDVRKANERVCQFHERFGAMRADENETDYFYKINLDAIAASRLRYKQFLEEGVGVIF
ncbi:GNAT family N-acetyltransferase [Serpentinimonas maccroryi]|uniref:GNAT family N-acetyltransferase n=1 Tax=Serpentinimonas maccroryi TaxID=1458426 RepID=UPI0009E4CC78|nr:GNAT family N-acetyltransferase [Serpentinimonas maccroryi]